MKKHILKDFSPVLLTIFMLVFGLGQTNVFAGTLTETLKKLFNQDISDFTQKFKLDNFEFMPLRYVSVKGDAAKFRALNWMNDGTATGIKDMTFEGDLGNGDHLSFQGHVISGDNDFDANLNLVKGNGNYVTLDYGNFRKWYDVYGGFYTNFGGQSISKLPLDPALDIGHFFFEAGSNVESEPGIALSYRRDTKEGTKSRLTWGDVVEGVTRKINPAWQDVSTAIDAIEIKGNVNVAGFNVKGKQKAEFYSGRTMREDNDSTEYVRTTQEPRSKQLVSSLRADRWMMNDKTYVSFGYQFQNSKSDMLETILAFDSTTGLPTGSSHNGVVDGWASRDSHSWVEHFATNLTPDLNFSTKLKQEIIASTGFGFRQGFLSGSNKADVTENQITRTGESLSLNYTGWSKTSLYTDWDFQQTRSWNSKAALGTSYTEYLDTNPESTGVMGIRYVFNNKVNMTSNVRLKSDRNTYDIYQNNDNAVSISRIRTKSDEWNNRLVWKPTKWFQNSFRVQLADTVYQVQSTPVVTPQRDWIKSNANSRVYTYDISVQPLDEWMFNVGASLNQFKVSTPASQTAVSGGGVPVYVADVYTLLLSTSYAPKENLSFYSSAQYSTTNDFDSHGWVGMPYGVNSEAYDITLGARWSPKKDLTLEPHYGYYSYKANPGDLFATDGYGNYSAHVVWLDTKFTW
ncbi:MAG: hypothetical protein WC676_01620 [Candidatus Omnitrophota bacterium]